MKFVTDYINRKDRKHFDDYCRREEAINNLPPHEYVAYFAGVNSSNIISELRAIKWLLVAVIILMITYANNTLPDGWWYKSWWS